MTTTTFSSFGNTLSSTHTTLPSTTTTTTTPIDNHNDNKVTLVDIKT